MYDLNNRFTLSLQTSYMHGNGSDLNSYIYTCHHSRVGCANSRNDQYQTSPHFGSLLFDLYFRNKDNAFSKLEPNVADRWLVDVCVCCLDNFVFTTLVSREIIVEQIKAYH